MEFREFLEREEKNESLMGIAKAGWNLAAGGARAIDGLAGMSDEAISKFVGDGTRGRMGREVAKFTGGLKQAFSGAPKTKSEPNPSPKTNTNSNNRWFYTNGSDGPHGPVTAQQLIDLASSGRLSRGDLVWRDGMRRWRKAGEATKLFPPETPKEPEPAPEPKPKSKKDEEWDRLVMRLRTEPHNRNEIMMRMGMLDRDRLHNLVRGSNKRRRPPL